MNTLEHCNLSMVVSLDFGGKSHFSNGQNVSFKEPCEITPSEQNSMEVYIQPVLWTANPKAPGEQIASRAKLGHDAFERK